MYYKCNQDFEEYQTGTAMLCTWHHWLSLTLLSSYSVIFFAVASTADIATSFRLNVSVSLRQFAGTLCFLIILSIVFFFLLSTNKAGNVVFFFALCYMKIPRHVSHFSLAHHKHLYMKWSALVSLLEWSICVFYLPTVEQLTYTDCRIRKREGAIDNNFIQWTMLLNLKRKNVSIKHIVYKCGNGNMN